MKKWQDDNSGFTNTIISKLFRNLLRHLGFSEAIRFLYLIKFLVIEKFLELLYDNAYFLKLINKFFAKIYKSKTLEIEIHGYKALFSICDIYSKLWFFLKYTKWKLYERAITLLLLDILKDAGCFVDVGTNLGWYTCLASKVMTSGIVFGFEIDDHNYELLRKNISLNECHNVKVYHAAVTDTSGWVSYVRKSRKPSPFYSLKSPLSMRFTNLSQEIFVESISLDNFFKHRNILPDVIKIDVEGAEKNVLDGMKQIMKNYAPGLIIEIHPFYLKEYKTSANDILDLLFENGYNIHKVLCSKNDVPEFSKISNKIDLSFKTILYAHKDNQERRIL